MGVVQSGVVARPRYGTAGGGIDLTTSEATGTVVVQVDIVLLRETIRSRGEYA